MYSNHQAHHGPHIATTSATTTLLFIAVCFCTAVSCSLTTQPAGAGHGHHPLSSPPINASSINVTACAASAPSCDPAGLGDESCAAACNTTECGYDGGDCVWCAAYCCVSAVGDAFCDPPCDVGECWWDGGDCDTCAPGCYLYLLADGVCDSACNVAACDYDGGDCADYCASGCLLSHVGDGVCDKACLNPSCNFDGGDCSASSSEKAALTAIYDDMGGLDWRNQLNWMSTSVVCTWYGVQCLGHAVNSLDLTQNRVSGQFSKAFLNFTYIRVILLPDNDISGPIEIPTSVQSLDLSSNVIAGAIPNSICLAGYLSDLSLADNKLTSIPECLGKLRFLGILDVSQNNISMGMPSWLEGTIVNTLSLSDNPVSGALSDVDWSTMTSLRSLSLANTLITPDVSLTKWPNTLSVLDLSGSNISMNFNDLLDSLPSSIQELYLRKTNVSGEITAATVSGLQSIPTLDLYGNLLTGAIPPDLGGIAFEYLDLSYNSLTGIVPNLTVSTYLGLQGNHFDCPLPKLEEEWMNPVVCYCTEGWGTSSKYEYCSKCPAGTYSYQSACLDCPEDFISAEGSTECTHCPTLKSSTNHIECTGIGVVGVSVIVLVGVALMVAVIVSAGCIYTHLKVKAVTENLVPLINE
ncbi:notch receptor protein [Pelomyxa schiedti]|nr:notch receptor protein [Pelomyxa schiedti]